MIAKSTKKKIFPLFVWILGISSFGILYSPSVAQRVYEYPLFQGGKDSVFLHFEDTLHVSAEGSFHYLYRWNVDGEKTGEESDFNIFFTGQRKTRVTGQRFSTARPWPGEYYYNMDQLRGANLISEAIDTVYLEWFSEYESDSAAVWLWVVEEDTLAESGARIKLTAKNEWLGRNIRVFCFFRQGNGESRNISTNVRFQGETGMAMRIIDGEGGHSYRMNMFHLGVDRIYAHSDDTVFLDAALDSLLYSEDSGFRLNEYSWFSLTCDVGELDRDSLAQLVFFRGTRYREHISAQREISCDTQPEPVRQSKDLYIYWDIDPDAEIETDSVWLFFPRYPYANLGGTVNICLDYGDSLPALQDALHVFNLAPDNRELVYVVYAWFNGLKDASGQDSIVGMDSVFYYTFGMMDSVSPWLYTGSLMTRVTADSLWQDTCQCYVACENCYSYDTVRITLRLNPYDNGERNLFLPYDTLLCAHRDLKLQVSDSQYRCSWLDANGVVLPYGSDTSVYVFHGLRGSDSVGGGTDTREPVRYYLEYVHPYCPSWTGYDTIDIVNLVQPKVEFAVHDTLICRNEPIDIEAWHNLVYFPAYGFSWTGKLNSTGAGESGCSDTSFCTIANGGLYTILFYMEEPYNICGYDTASDILNVLWVDPVLTDFLLPGDTGFCPKLSVTLDVRNPFESTRYEWRNGAIDNEDLELDSIISVEPRLTFKEEGLFNVSLIDSMNCRHVAEVNIVELDCTPAVEIPNVFTPNGDGINDVWRFKSLEKCRDVQIEVVNRWGNLVLKENVKDIQDFSWNGCLHNGSTPLPDGPYFYMVSYKNLYGRRKVQSGSVTILGTKE